MNKYIILLLLISKLAFSYINIYPTKFSERIDGKGAFKVFTLANNTDEELRYRIYLEDEKENKLSPFVEIYPKSISLKPSEKKEFKVFVKAAKNTKNGKYTTKLVVKQVGLPNKEKKDKDDIFTIFKLKMFGFVGEKQNVLIKKDLIDFKNISFFDKLNDNYIYTADKISYLLDENFKIKKLDYEIVNKVDNSLVYVRDNKYGVLDKDLNVILKDFDLIMPSNAYGIYLAKKDNFFGSIDETSKIAANFVYDRIFQYKNNYALIFKNGNFGLIDKRGRYILPPLYQEIYFAENGNYIFKKNDKYIDSSGKVLDVDKIYPTFSSYPIFEKNESLGVIDLYRLKLSDNNYSEISLNIDNSIILSKENKYALVNVHDFFENRKIDYEYNYVTRLSENMYIVSDDDSGLEKLVNTRINEKSENYEKIERINDNVFFAKNDDENIDIYTRNKGKIRSIKKSDLVFVNDKYLVLDKDTSYYEIIDVLEEKPWKKF